MAGYQGTSTRRDPSEALAAAIEADRREMMTVATGRIGSAGAGQRASVKPSLKRRFGDQVLEAPILEDVPVLFPRGNGFIFHPGVKSGDEVVLVFAARSLDQNAADGTDADGRPGRMHSISDAMAIPASHSATGAAQGLPADKLHIGTDDGKGGLQVGKTGTADVVSNGDSVLTIMTDLVTMFRDHLTAGFDHDKIAAANDLLARIATMKG